MNVGSSQNSMLMRQAMHQQVQQLRQNADGDASGGLNIGEFTALRDQVAEIKGRPNGPEDITELFAAIDVDESGELSQEEMQTFHQDRMAERRENMGGKPMGGMMSAQMQELLLQLQETDSTETSVEDLFAGVEEAV